MSEQPKFRAVRGVRDILPPQTTLWNRVEQTAREVFGAYGFGEIRLPILEEMELFARSVGGGTDIVSKEMYSFDVYAFERFFRQQHEMVGSIQNPIRFTGCLWELLSTLQFAWESERIDRTPSNKKAIELLTGIYKTLYDGLADDRVALAAHNNPEISKLISQAILLVREIQMDRQIVVLRPEATASVVRAYIEHGMHTLPGSVKLYYMGPMFRRERPQKGRYRQFYQIGAEMLSQSDAPTVDAEVIEMLMDYFGRLQLAGTTLFVNSIGCKDCRAIYVEKLRNALREVREQLGADSQWRIETNPLRVLDSKVPQEQPIIETLPRIANHLCAACSVHFDEVQAQLKLRGVAYKENWRLVRGLDYYTRTTFEIIAPGLGSQNAVCGGGRYDGLVELLGGPPTKGIGFAIGLDRLILSLQDLGKGSVQAGPDVFIAWMGKAAWPLSVRVARRLRDVGIAVEVPAEEMKFRKALGLADKLGARYALILGEDEVASGQLTLKRLTDGDQRKFTAEELTAHLRAELHHPA